MKNLLHFAVFALSGALAFGQSPAPANTAQGPMIQFDKTEYNFGKVNAGDPVMHTYYVTNTGTSTLTISDVHPSCGCTTAHPWTRQIAAGQSGSIPIQFNSSRYSGTVMKTIAVTSNAKNEPHATLRLTGTIFKAIDVSPQTAFINIPSDGTSSASATVRITGNMDKPLTLTNVQSSSRRFTAELKEIRPGKEFQLVVTAVPPFETGNTPGTITMDTSLPSSPHLTVTAIAYKRVSVQVSPSRVVLSPQPNHWTTNSVFIANSDFTGFTLSDPQSSDPRLKVSLQRLQPGQPMYNLWIVVPPGFQETPGKPVEITVKSNHPQHPVIQIPVMQFPRARAYWSNPASPTPAVAKHP